MQYIFYQTTTGPDHETCPPRVMGKLILKKYWEPSTSPSPSNKYLFWNFVSPTIIHWQCSTLFHHNFPDSSNPKKNAHDPNCKYVLHNWLYNPNNRTIQCVGACSHGSVQENYAQRDGDYRIQVDGTRFSSAKEYGTRFSSAQDDFTGRS